MPAQPDRDTLVLRAPDRRSPTDAAALVRRVLARPPAPSLADVSLAPPDRALVSLHGRYPGVEAHYPEPVRWAAAHGPAPQPRGRVRKPCAWCMARVRARHRGQPAPRVDVYSLALLGDPCPTCAPIVDPQPKPQPKPKPRRAARSRTTARSSTAARSSTSTRTRRLAPAELVASTRAGLTAAAIAYNRSRVGPLGIPRERAAHLTGGTRW